MVDNIFVLSKGKLIESGHHQVLMAAKGHYYNMFNKQQISE
jgi:ABC-type multidrug transport system fused ATPase/permease subunit